MTIKDYLDTFNLEHEQPYEDAVLLKWLNLTESGIDILKTYTVKYFPRSLNAFQYALPSGVSIEDIMSVRVNGAKYRKKDVKAYKEPQSYWFEDGKLCIYPVCTENDLNYVSGASEITFADSTITTAGAEFTFSVGDVILVSGAAENANNKYATVIGTAAKTLTFAAGTFTAGADAEAVTIAKPKIRVVYENKPATKLIANIATDTLLLPGRFIEIYDFFLMSKIAYLQKDYNEYANHQTMFNGKVREFEDWYSDHRPQYPEDEIVSAEAEGYSSRRGFDYE